MSRGREGSPETGDGEAATTNGSMSPGRDDSLDPPDWDAFRRTAHAFLDRAIDGLAGVRDQPVWRPVPESVRAAWRAPLPYEPAGTERTCEEALERIAPYATGNIHPRFFGWVHGSGTAGGILAGILTAALNANSGGRDHGAIYVERQIIEWCREIFGFPPGTSGILLSGTSMATALGLAVARALIPGVDVREQGVRGLPPLQVYASREAHVSVAKAADLLGLGRQALRRVPVHADHSMRVEALRAMVAEDRRQGRHPLCVVATAGTVNTGAFDDLEAIAAFCAEAGVWLHVDGAFGAWLRLAQPLAHHVAGIERADSLAFDFHKWLHVPYDAGCLLVRHGEDHLRTFVSHPDYLAPAARGLAGGQPWFCDLGPELSRSARAIKVWFTLREHGLRRLGEKILDNCRQAGELAQRVSRHPELALAAPVASNIVCWRFLAPPLSPAAEDQLQLDLVADLQESGMAAPSTTRLDGRTVIRVNLTNHRTRAADLDRLVDEVLRLGRQRIARTEPSSSTNGTAVPSLAILLASGGDSRLGVDATTGLNRYGCSPRPRPQTIALASTTASSISCGAQDHVETTRRRLLASETAGRLDETVALIVDEIGRDILRASAAPPGTEVLLTASGTEAELVALFLALSASPAPLTSIVVGPAEIGTHSPIAAAGRHFDSPSPLGATVAKGDLLDPAYADRVRVVEVDVRHRDGRLRPGADVDRDVEVAVEQAVSEGRRVLLHVIDVTKTGLIAPGIATVVRLAKRHPLAVDVVVDACQLRLAPATLQAYLQAGFLLMISGSKFLTGPPFAGALLVPAAIGARVASGTGVPTGLRAYAARAQWPRAWKGLREGLPAVTNLGLLLRWQAALWEARRFAQVPDQTTRALLSRLALAIGRAIAERSYLGLIETRDLDRGPLAVPGTWDTVRTIFTFTVAVDAQPLPEPELALLHDWMNRDLSDLLPPLDERVRQLAATICHLGRPVCVARAEPHQVAGLRVSVSARQIASLAFDPALGGSTEERLTRVIDDVQRAFAKLDLVVAHRAHLARATAAAPARP